ncbi:MAG: O-antigen ligase family protein, partial [Candidatus Hodarchaeota archaeon]
MIINWINGINVEYLLLNAIILFSTLLVGFCTMYFIKNEKQFKTFIYYLIGFMSISAFVAIMQFIGVDFFWRLRELLGIDPNIEPGILERTRVPGLALYSIPLGYQLASVVPFIFGILNIKKEKRPFKFYLLVTFVICLLALISIKGRSAILAGIIGMIVIVFLSFTKRKLIALIFLLIILVLTFYIFHSKFAIYRFTFKDISTPLRISAFIISGKIFINNPIGIGINWTEYYYQYSSEFKELSYIFAEKFTPYQTSELQLYLENHQMSPHNHFINILLYYGIFGLLLLILFYKYIFKGLMYVYRNEKSSKFIFATVTGLIGAFIAYVVNDAKKYDQNPWLWVL